MNQHAETAPVKSNGTLNPWFSIWIRPRQTIRQLTNESKFGWLLLLACLGGISYFLDTASTSNLGDRANASAGGIVLIGLFVGPFIGLIGWQLFSAICFGIGKLFGGEATLKETQYAVAWASVPLVFSLLIWIPDLAIMGDGAFSESVSAVNPFGATIVFFTAFLEIIIGIWYVVILVKAIAEVNQFSAWKGLAVIVLPVLFLLVFAILLVYIS